jgi:hypothetical protein
MHIGRSQGSDAAAHHELTNTFTPRRRSDRPLPKPHES